MERLTFRCKYDGSVLLKSGATNVLDRLAEYEDAEERGELVRVVRCEDCKHRDPEDKKCDCSGLEHAHLLPVPDDWFCGDAVLAEREVDDG